MKTSVVFDDFDGENEDSAWRVDFAGRAEAPDLDGEGGVACWAQWCYRVTALADIECCPGEWTHMSIGVPDEEPYTSVESLIEQSMTVSENDADYTKKFRSSGGPLMMRGAEWNNEGDHLLEEGESAVFCFTAPDSPVSAAPIGMKVGSIRLFDTIAGPGKHSCPVGAPTTTPWGAGLLILTLFSIRLAETLHRR
ncbi:MAG: hypothetical protein KatS3mg076_1999 [Candidatus Binatia bacterium]|nr:MAG: hypothetical protein KatS3mg076_1999 [Candidatus Binatia bacterium]